MFGFPDSMVQVEVWQTDRQTDRGTPALLCPTHLLATYLGSLGRQVCLQFHESHIHVALFPNHPHASSPQEAQNPGETSAYFFGGDFDLQEFCFPGQHLPWGVDPDKDRSLAFALQDTKGKEIETLVRTQRKFSVPSFRSPKFLLLQFGSFVPFKCPLEPMSHTHPQVSILFQICSGCKVSVFPKCGPRRLAASWGKQNNFINRFENYTIMISIETALIR